jgi:YidC/Oxa1 family membrane protein insertase
VTAAPTQAPNLCPASPQGADPFSLIAWIFTPIFQVLFMGLAFFYRLLGDVGFAIVALTIVIRILLVPIFRAQIVSQRRMQILQPELRSLQQKYKGDRARISQEQLRLYKERGINPASGCLPALLQLVLLIPMYSVFNLGLSAPDVSSMLQVFGQQIPFISDLACTTTDASSACLDPAIWWLGDLPANRPEILYTIPGIGFGLSALAVLSALLQLVQTRMLTPSTSDPQARAQQRIFLILPLFSIIYGSFLPAGLFIYWIVTTIFSIVQQYLIAGWGALFPLFGWTPSFARDHTPRFPVAAMPVASTATGGGRTSMPVVRRSAEDRAAGTVRPARAKGRTSRRGRRR